MTIAIDVGSPSWRASCCMGKGMFLQPPLATNRIDQPCWEIQTLDLQVRRQHLRKHNRRPRLETQDKKIEDNSSSVEQRRKKKKEKKINIKRVKSTLASALIEHTRVLVLYCAGTMEHNTVIIRVATVPPCKDAAEIQNRTELPPMDRSPPLA